MQMKQRAIMATAIHAYSAMSEICDHSFEKLTYGQKSMNYFVSENARMIRSSAPKVNLSLFKGISVSNAYIISKGSLPAITLTHANESGVELFNKEIEVAPATLTFGQFMGAFGANVIGDMVTFANLVDNPGGNASFYWLRLKLTETNKTISLATTSSTAVDVLSKLSEGTDFETNIDNFSTSDFPIKTKVAGDATLVTIGAGSSEDTPVQQSMGIILSRKSDTGWLRSSSTMVNLFETFNYAEALASYPESGEKILNGGNM